MLYRERTLDEWKALPPFWRDATAQLDARQTDYGFVADAQATRDAALGKAVREWFLTRGTGVASPEICDNNAEYAREHGCQVAASMWDELSSALAAEAVADAKENLTSVQNVVQ